MNYLLFFITLFFSLVLFIFYKLNNGLNIFSNNPAFGYNFSSITGNLLIDSVIFLFISIILFFYFSSFRFSNVKKIKKNIGEIKDDPLFYQGNIKENKKNILKKINFKNIFSQYIYYIGFILFYISIYLILYSLGIKDFNYIILFLNILIFLLFFISDKAEIFKDFIKINTILFSLYYIFLFLYIFINGINIINSVDFINTIFIFCFFIITFYGSYKNSKFISKNKSSLEKNIIKPDNSLILYFFIYSFIVFSFYFRLFFIDYLNFYNIKFSLIFIYISIFLNFIIYFILQKVSFFSSSKYILRALSFLFGYIAIIFGFIFFIKNLNNNFIDNFITTLNNFIIFFIIIYLIIFNFNIHKKFQNYISLFFSLFSFIFLLNFILYKNYILLGGNLINLELILNFSISYFIIIFTYIYYQKYSFDYFFLHICAYLVNILGIIYYLIYGNLDLFNIGIILLLDSILIFLSYFKLKNINKN